MGLSVREINAVYLAYFGRPADATGLEYFAQKTVAELVQTFDASAESLALYGTRPEAKIHAIYHNLFNRPAEPDGMAYWLGQVNSGILTPAEVAWEVLQGARNQDQLVVNNKLLAADAFVQALDSPSERVGYLGLNAARKAVDWWKTIDSTAASLANALTNMDGIVQDITGVGAPVTPPPLLERHLHVASRMTDVLTLHPDAVDLFATRLGDGSTPSQSAPRSGSELAQLDRLQGFELGRDKLQLTDLAGERVVPTVMFALTLEARSWTELQSELLRAIGAADMGIGTGEAAYIDVQWPAGGIPKDAPTAHLGSYLYVNDAEDGLGQGDVLVRLDGVSGSLPSPFHTQAVQFFFS